MKEWKEFLNRLESELGEDILQKWVPRCTHFDAANVYLEATDSFQITWFEEHIRPKLKGFVNQNQRPIRVHLAQKALPKPQKIEGTPVFTIREDELDPDKTLERFITTDENRIIYTLLKETSPFNPLYLYGPKGSGKTHLLMGAAHAFKKEGKTVFFVSAQTFTDHVVQAIRLAQMREFRSIYRDIDILIVDDVHLFSKRNATQEEFFHTFNSLHTLGRPILLSANASPTLLNNIEPRLISRFEWGISLELVQSPMTNILESKADLWHFSLPEVLKQWLLDSFPQDPILALSALAFRSNGQILTVKTAELLLKDLLENEKKGALTFEKIVKTVAAQYGITSEDILGKSQIQTIALPRQIAMYYCREKLKLPYQKIGALFHKDHSTVMSSTKLIQKKIEEKALDPLEFISK